MSTVAFVTLGCKLNFAESATLQRAFVQRGYTCVSASKPADVYVINTCSVTEHADKKCRQAIRKLLKQNTQAVVAVTGCYAQLKPQEVLSIPGVTLVLGAQYKDKVVERVEAHLSEKASAECLCCPTQAIEGFFPAHSTAERTRAFLKVQDGCDYYCSYCTVPLARGASRNTSIASLVEQAQEIAQAGVKEIVLTGVNTGDFGKTTGEAFFDLLRALARVEGIHRYRISSIEPNLLTNEIIDWLAVTPQFMPHFHIPLQSGCDAVLERMRRRYTTAFFAQKVQYIKEQMPFAFIGIDVIVGFPGETEADFETTYRFLEQLNPAFLHVFPYSVRPHTRAAAFPVEERVDPLVTTYRAHRLGLLCEQLHSAFYEANRGRVEEVLFEGKIKNGLMQGYTRNYLRVERPYDKSKINEIVLETV